MNILIAGGSGFLGRQLSLALLPLGYKIIWVSQNPNNATLPEDIQVIDYSMLKTLTTPINIVINLAGSGIADQRWSDKRKRELFDSRIKPTTALLDFIKDNSVSLFISSSAIGYYGISNTQMFNETSLPICQDFSSNLCQTWENLALSIANDNSKSGLNHIVHPKVVIIRTGVVLDANGGMMTRLLPVFRLGLGGKLGTGKQILSWISIRDWVRAVIFIIQKNTADHLPNTQIYNLTNPNAITNIEFTKEIGKLLNRPTMFHLPSWLLRWAMGEMATLLIDGQKVYPDGLLSLGFEFKDNSLDFLKEQL